MEELFVVDGESHEDVKSQLEKAKRRMHEILAEHKLETSGPAAGGMNGGIEVRIKLLSSEAMC